MSKYIYAAGLLAKKEVTYNGGGSPSAATDGVLIDENLKIPASYANDGSRPAPPGILGHQRRVVPSARVVSFPIKVSAKGSGAAYSSTVAPSGINVLLQAAGFDAAVAIGAGTESYTYTPTPFANTPTSSVLNAYGRNQMYAITGAYTDLVLEAQGPVVPTWVFTAHGVMAGAITDVALPAITYPALTLDPPKATNITFTLGSLTAAVVRKFTLKMGRHLAPRLNQNAGGHAGFAPGRRAPQLDVTFEATSLTGTPFTTSSLIDPYQLFEAGTTLACSLNVGTVQYNRWSLTAGNAQIMAAPLDEDDGPTAMISLSLQLNPTAINNNDDVTFLFN